MRGGLPGELRVRVVAACVGCKSDRRQHWNRGHGTVKVGISPRAGREILKLEQEAVDLYYHQGPLLVPAADPKVPDFVE